MKQTLLILSLFLNFSLWSQEEATPEEKPQTFEWVEDYSQAHLWREQEKVAFGESKKWQTNAVVIIHKDKILYERYENDFDKNKPHRVWSVSKSFSSALWGLRFPELGLSEGAFAKEFSSHLKEPQKSEIRMRDLLQMSSGIFWNEFYEGNPFQSHVVKMLYLDKQKDMASFTASQRMRDRPGQYFNYSSGETNLLMGILKETFENPEDYHQYPWKKLFEPLGMTNVTWERDGNGVFVGSSYLYMKPRDLARFGRLYLNHGTWDNNQIIPKQYVLNSLKASPSSCQNNRKGSMRKFTYGYQWWLNFKCPEKNIQSIPDIPENVFMALGHHGQTMAIFPDQQLIAVRMGADKRKRFNREAWLQAIYKTLNKLN